MVITTDRSGTVDEDSYAKQEQLLEKPQTKLRETKIRWIVLAFACFSCFGSYFSSDLPTALQTPLMQSMQLELLKYNLIFSFYSFPNIILPIIGGMIIIYLGVRVTYAVCGFLVIVGQVIITIGVINLNFPMILVGRVVFALGSDIIIVCKTAIITKWFMGKELSFGLGAGLCIGRLGSSLDSFISPKVNAWTGLLYMPFLVGIILCTLSWIVILCLNYLDRKTDMLEKQTQQTEEQAQRFSFKEIKKLKVIYRLLLLSTMFLYPGFFTFTGNINNLMVKRFGFTSSSAGNVIPIIYICPVVVTPIVGTLIDKYGKRILIILIVCIIFFFDHLAIAFLPDAAPGTTDYTITWGLLVAGLFYATYAAVLWPCVALVVPEKLVGIAYGFCFSCDNIIQTVAPLIIGVIHDKTQDYKEGYFWTEIALAGVVLGGVLVGFWMYYEDKKKGGKLDKPGTERSDNESDLRASLVTQEQNA